MPKKITLPNFLKKRLEESDYDAVVSQALKDFGKWFADESKQTFFPDYTNHGIQHIEQVLDTATNLIPDKARDYFSAADAAALILAVLLHDSALHISKAGFHYLIKGPKEGVSPYVPVARFDQADWGQAWSDFMFLARRWDDQMLLNVFGPEEGTDAPRAQVRDPFDHWSNLSETDELLIGEFIRKHHPRLAHEMALHGVPGKEAIHLKLADDLPPAWRDLVGLIARSHGLPLRTSVDYLRQTPHFGSNGQRGYQNVHAIYLMALLRVADYVQIQGDRTTERIFTFKDIPSLISRIEHKVHQSDVLISDDAEDPESLQIDASPKEVAVFLRLKEWLAGIQQELDSSWAVLGEVYGRYPKLKKLGLAFRRVRSNLDDVTKFAKTVPYVPDRIRFDVARAELLKLLIGPLYGDDPSYGVRELMQNSIDAVREYDQFVLDNPEYANVPRREQEADVVVELGPFDEAKGYAVMTISDRGIGMTEATIRDYFLKAGASFRQSAEWKTAFENDNFKNIKSKVLRSGRFGVGALAAFLIGEIVEVDTQHVGAKDGFRFKAGLASDVINVFRTEKLGVGTCIKIQVNRVAYKELLKKNSKLDKPRGWDWYCFQSPSLMRISNDAKAGINKQYNRYAFRVEDCRYGWRKIYGFLDYDIYWSFNDAPNLTCNGIYISNSAELGKVPQSHFSKAEGFSINNFRYPNIAVIDADGMFPLSLQRNNMRVNDYPFGGLLVREFLTEMLVWLFFHGPSCIDSSLISKKLFSHWLVDSQAGLVLADKSGYALKINAIIQDYKFRHIIYCGLGVNIALNDNEISISGMHDGISSNHNLHLGNRFVKMEISKKWDGRRQLFFDSSLLKRNAPERIVYELGNMSSIYSGSNNAVLEEQSGAWATYKSEGCPPAGYQLKTVPTDSVNYGFHSLKNGAYLEEYFYSQDAVLNATSPPWLLDELWQEHFGKGWIPFALEDRIAKFPAAAKFFAERYPQVVPAEAWVLLGGKPTVE